MLRANEERAAFESANEEREAFASANAERAFVLPAEVGG